MIISHQWPVASKSRSDVRLTNVPRTTDLDPLLQRLKGLLECEYVVALSVSPNGHHSTVGSVGDSFQIDFSACIARLFHTDCAGNHCGALRAPPDISRAALKIAAARPDERNVSALSVRIPAGIQATIVIIAVRRCLFNAEDERSLRHYTDWVADYVAIWWRLRGGEQHRSGLQSALDQVGLALIMLDRDGRTLGINDTARHLLMSGDGMVAIGETLSCAMLEDAVRLHSVIGHTLLGPIEVARAPVLTIRRRRRRPLVVAVLRVAADPGPGETAIVLQIIEPDRNHNSAITAACTLFGFTGAEARLAQLLAGGASLAEAATALRIQMPTARTYLKQAFVKSGTNRQAALVQVLLSSLVRLRDGTVPTAV